MKPFLVWSEEHGAWWKPGRMGYTRSIREAGRYSLDEASEIVENANRYVRDGFNEIAVFDPITSFTCPRCGAVSHNRHDVEHRYCGRCHVFVDED